MMSRRTASLGLLTLLLLMPSCATAPKPRPLPLPTPVIADTSWPRREVLALAMQAYQCGQREGQFERPVLTVIDYSLPSREPRLWVIDVEHRLAHELVAHGEGSGDAMAVAFSNESGSHQSSLGLFRTVYAGSS